MSSLSGTFNADGQVSNPIRLRPGQSISYSFTTAGLTGSVVVEKTSKLGAGYTVVATHTETGSGTYVNETHEEIHVRVRCVELDDDPGSETVAWTLADVSKNNTFEYEDPQGTIKETELSEFSRTILDDTDASSVRATIGVPSIIDAGDAQASVLSQVDFTSSEPGSPSEGDRYINTSTGTSSGTSQSVTENYIYEWNDGDSVWDEAIPNEGAICTDENVNLTLLYNGTAWINLAGYTVHNSLTSLQGGTSNEYYHLTSAQHTAMAAMVTAGVDALTSDEVDQLEAIGSTTISAAQWGYLGALDQGLTTGSDVEFNSLVINSSAAASGDIKANSWGIRGLGGASDDWQWEAGTLGLSLKDDANNAIIQFTQPTHGSYATVVRLPQIGTGTGTAVIADGNNSLLKDSSSKRYKRDIEKVRLDDSILDKLEPVVFTWKQFKTVMDKDGKYVKQEYKDEKTEKKDFGYVAEEVLEVEPKLVMKNTEGQAESVFYQKLSIFLQVRVNKHEKTIKDLLKRINVLESKII